MSNVLKYINDKVIISNDCVSKWSIEVYVAEMAIQLVISNVSWRNVSW